MSIFLLTFTMYQEIHTMKVLLFDSVWFGLRVLKMLGY